MTGCDKTKSPEGTAYFVIVKYRNSGTPYAAWVSIYKPCVPSNNAYCIGYNNKREEIFREGLDTDEANDSKVVDLKVLDINKCGAFYEVHKDIWRGKAPRDEFIKNVNLEDVVKFSGKVRKHKLPLVSDTKKNKKPEKELENQDVSYTYRIERERDEYYRYCYVIIRSDNTRIIGVKTEDEAERLIQYLK
jgi:hypothetical protein